MTPHIRRIITFCVLAVAAAMTVQADIVVLHSGKRMKGEIVVRNEQVVILRNETGARFQFPASEVKEIVAEEQPAVEQEQEQKSEAEKQKTSARHPVALRIMLSGGAACISNGRTGGLVEAEFRIGTRNLADKRVFLGGSVGWHGAFFGNGDAMTFVAENSLAASVEGTRHFIPLQAVVSVPLLPGTHAPEIGASLGYGFCTGGNAGGLTGGFELSWRWQIRQNTAFMLGWHAQFQQSACMLAENIGGSLYSRSASCTFVFTGAVLSLQF